MILMNNKLLGNKVMFPSLEGSNKGIKLLIICGVVERGTMKFLNKVSNRVFTL